MAKNQVARGKLVRKYGANIFGNPKYDKLLNRKPYSPGQHGQSRRSRLSNFGLQLKEKQKIKFMYGLLEKQFSNCFEKADKMKGETGTNLLQLLERRLDNVVYRLGFASTRAEARQLVNHKTILVNESYINIPSYQLSPGDVVTLSEKAKSQDRVKNALDTSSTREDCDWLEMNKKDLVGTFKSIPTRDLLDSDINENLIIELYSK